MHFVIFLLYLDLIHFDAKHLPSAEGNSEEVRLPDIRPPRIFLPLGTVSNTSVQTEGRDTIFDPHQAHLNGLEGTFLKLTSRIDAAERSRAAERAEAAEMRRAVIGLMARVNSLGIAVETIQERVDAETRARSSLQQNLEKVIEGFILEAVSPQPFYTRK
jgi:hypothetical protein